MKIRAAVAIETGQTLVQIGQGLRRWVFPAKGRPQVRSPFYFLDRGANTPVWGET
jgi:hypothetical protein